MPVFNVYEKTNPRKKSKPFNEGATAGTAKVSSRGGKSREELKALGDRNGWTVRELSMREICQQMSADEVVWHEVFNKENFDKAVERDAVAGERKNIDAQWAVRRMWEGGATPAENEKCRIAGDSFARRTPQFARTMGNAMLMIEHMQAHDLDATKIETYTTAFRELTEQGKLTVAPAESADDFLRNHPELHDRRTPPLIQVREDKAARTAKHFEAAANATAKGTVVNITDYPTEQSGYPAAPTKYSFRRLLDSLSAEDYQKRLNEDRQFAAAIDKLNSK
jgi:hypothetical protein